MKNDYDSLVSYTQSVSIEDKESIEKYINLYPPYSDYNFASLWVWNTKKNILVSRLNNNLDYRFNMPTNQKETINNGELGKKSP